MDIVDFHAHILPRADHGSSSSTVSLRQLELAKECGVSRIIATPHFYAHRDSVESFLRRRNACAARLFERIGEVGCDVDIALGAEVLVCDNMSMLPRIKELCISGTDTILLELPFSDISSVHLDSVRDIGKMGLNVVLAHADRYDPQVIEGIIKFGNVKLQLNANSLATVFRRKHLYNWLEKNHVIALGSDIHGTDEKAYKRFAIAKRKAANYLEYIKGRSDEIWAQAVKNAILQNMTL